MQKKIKPLTIEEVIEFKPSMDNPMMVECFSGRYEDEYKTMKIVAVYKDRYAYIAMNDVLQSQPIDDLKDFASLKQPKEKIALYQTLDSSGEFSLCDTEGRFPNFDDNVFSGVDCQNFFRKKNRSKKPVAFLDSDTFEVEWV